LKARNEKEEKKVFKHFSDCERTWEKFPVKVERNWKMLQTIRTCTQRPILNFAPRGKFDPTGEVVPQG
jgi:hypothetical protein